MPLSPHFATYDDTLDALSAASVNKHFDAFEDIAWDDPELAVDPADPRWKLPTVDPLGRHPWYLALPEEEQIRIGLLRQANIAKIGTHFETALMRGLLQYVVTLPNGSREFRYCMHEVTEETNHTQMFQEFVNRAGADVPGAVWWFRLATQFVPALMWLAPEVFFLMVLMGEAAYQPGFVLAADTVVAVGRRILPKAETTDDAVACLQLLSGRAHRVYSGICLITPAGMARQRLVETRVRFKRLSRNEIDRYVASGQWRGKAGGYAVQGLAGSFVVRLVGSYTNVVGLPLYETAALLAGEGFDVHGGWPAGVVS